MKPAARKTVARQTGSSQRQSRQVLSLSPVQEDATALRRILGGVRWRIAAISTYREAIAYLKRKPVAAVVCEQTLADGGWKDILHLLASTPTHPALIVTSRLADD